MERFHQLLLESDRSFKTADHLAYVTYPLLKEIKLTLIISNNIFTALSKAMEAVLEYDRYYKNIYLLPEDFNSKLQVFTVKCIPRYEISPRFIDILKEMKRLAEGHKSSPIEIVRDDKYLIFSEAYRDMQTVDIEKLKGYIFELRPILDNIYKIGM